MMLKHQRAYRETKILLVSFIALHLLDYAQESKNVKGSVRLHIQSITEVSELRLRIYANTFVR